MIDSAETSFSSCGMPAYSFKTFIRHAAAAPRRSDVFPVMIRPSSISIAVAGCPVSSARRSAGRRTLRSSGVTCACLSSSSCLYSSFGEAFPFLTFTALSKYLRIISCFAASLQTASSEIANPAMLTPMSVGDLYGENLLQHRENLNVPVIVDRRLSVSFQMERINHVHIREVGGCRLVGKIDRVLERQVPNRERLELRVAC